MRAALRVAAWACVQRVRIARAVLLAAARDRLAVVAAADKVRIACYCDIRCGRVSAGVSRASDELA